MTTELRKKGLADGDVLVDLSGPAAALLLGAGLDDSLRSLRGLLLGGLGVHLVVGGVGLLLIFLRGDEDLTLPLKLLFCCFSTAAWTTPLSSRRLKRRDKNKKMCFIPEETYEEKLKQETGTRQSDTGFLLVTLKICFFLVSKVKEF